MIQWSVANWISFPLCSSLLCRHFYMQSVGHHIMLRHHTMSPLQRHLPLNKSCHQHSRLDYCRKSVSTHNKVGVLMLADFLLWKRSVLQRQHQGCSSPLYDQMAYICRVWPTTSSFLILSWYKPPDFKFTVHPKYPFKIFQNLQIWLFWLITAPSSDAYWTCHTLGFPPAELLFI